MKLQRVVVSSSNVLTHYLAGGEGKGDLAKEEALPRPVTFYATTKQTIENLGLNYARWCGVDFAAVRYGAVAGPWSGRGGGGPSNIFRDAVREARWPGPRPWCPRARWNGSMPRTRALGTVLALKAATLSPVASSTSPWATVTPPGAFARALKDACRERGVIIADPPGAGQSLMNMRHGSDLAVSRAELGYAPRFDIDGGGRATWSAWYRSNERRRGADSEPVLPVADRGRASYHPRPTADWACHAAIHPLARPTRSSSRSCSARSSSASGSGASATSSAIAASRARWPRSAAARSTRSSWTGKCRRSSSRCAPCIAARRSISKS